MTRSPINDCFCGFEMVWLKLRTNSRCFQSLLPNQELLAFTYARADSKSDSLKPSTKQYSSARVVQEEGTVWCDAGPVPVGDIPRFAHISDPTVG
jgi:hypothetical protein